MANLKIVFFEVPEEEKFRLKEFEILKGATFFEEKLTEETAPLAKDAEIISIFINSEIKKEILDLLPNLKLIVTRSTGFDHIDIESAESRGVALANVPSYGSRSVAEFTFALMLSVSRKVFIARHKLLEGDDFDISSLEGFDLFGKTLGVVGTGKIGKNVIRIARSFGLKVIAVDPYPDEVFAREMGFEYVELESLLQSSDIVTLHAPYSDSTYHLINKDNISLMKQGSYLINTARGELVETSALVQALASGQLAGAGLDVLEEERFLKEEIALLAKGEEHKKDYKTLFENQVILDMPQVVVTPHIAFCSKEAKREIEETTVENIEAFLRGEPKNLIKTQ